MKQELPYIGALTAPPSSNSCAQASISVGRIFPLNMFFLCALMLFNILIGIKKVYNGTVGFSLTTHSLSP